MDGLSPEDPRTLGAYRLLARLGAGGMGRVYLARSDRGRTVAVKLVRPELAGQEEFRRRFRQEVRAAQRVGGEWTAPVLDADTEADIPWVATGYIAGPSLSQVVEEDHGPLPERSVRILGAGLARALQAVHAAGIVHRDLKPSNVLITLDGPRVIDFGIARALETVTDGGLTRTGATVGSPGFMSPEQVRGAHVTPASDIFCLGSVLAYAATGRMPFGTADSGVHALMYRIAQEEPDLTGVPDPLRPLIAAFLAKDPAERPTPEQVLERTGVQDLLPELRFVEPWLPGQLVAQLARHAVRLLEVEDPTGAGASISGGAAAPAPAPASEAPTSVGPPQHMRLDAPRTVTAPASQPLPPAAPAGYGPYPPTVVAPAPAPRRSKTPYILTAVILAGLLTGGGTVFLLGRHTDDGGDKGNNAAPASSPAASAPPGSAPVSAAPAPVPSPATPSPSDAKNTGSGAVPQTFLGNWQSDFSTSGGPNTRRIVIRQGPVGTTVADISGSGTSDDGTVYRCAWTAPLAGGGDAGSPLRLGPSTVTLGEPAGACQPGTPTELTILPDGELQRQFTGTDKAPLTYRRTS